MPCVFVCDENGFFEPTLRRIFSQGRPFMPKVDLDKNISSFLEQVWKDCRSLSFKQCKQEMINLPLYADCYRSGSVTVVSSHLMRYAENKGVYGSSYSQQPFRKKVLVSQNGPVIVSQWSPRKVNK